MPAFGLMLAAVAALQSSVPGPCPERLCYAENLRPFFERLAQARPGEGDPVHIIQIGDSHTAGDMITNGWRIQLQNRYGRGGRGVLAAGQPYNGYLTWGVTASESEGWSTNGIFGSMYSNYGQPVGISGYTQTARRAGETLGIVTDTLDYNFDRITVCAIKQPGGGTILMRMGYEEESFELDSPTREPACRSMESDYPVSAASLTTLDDRVVTITSFGTFRKQGGVVLTNLGVSGSQLVHMGREDDSVMRTELREYRPALVVLAFGTNEGFDQQLSVWQYESDLRNQVNRIRRLAGEDVPILLIGAPDAATRNAGLADNGGRSPPVCDAGWMTPTLLTDIRHRQRMMAGELGLAFWDWDAAMGGRCSAHRWRLRELMRGDHVHFTEAGGLEIGRILFGDFERAADATRMGD